MAKKTVVRQVVYFGEEEWVDMTLNNSLPLGKSMFKTSNDGVESYIEIRQLEPLTGFVLDNFERKAKSGKQEG
jgi:hypothetical protein